MKVIDKIKEELGDYALKVYLRLANNCGIATVDVIDKVVNYISDINYAPELFDQTNDEAKDKLRIWNTMQDLLNAGYLFKSGSNRYYGYRINHKIFKDKIKDDATIDEYKKAIRVMELGNAN